MSYQTSDIRKGLKIEMDGAPWNIVDFQFVKPGKGQAFTRTKMKNLLTGNTVDRTFKTGETLQEADIEEKTMSYLYAETDMFHFMDTSDYQQVGIVPEVVGDAKDWLIEQMECQILFYKQRPVSIELPNFVNLEITYCEPGVRGNTAQGTTKPATVSTGAIVGVPLFIEAGEVITIDTRTGEYVGRAS